MIIIGFLRLISSQKEFNQERDDAFRKFESYKTSIRDRESLLQSTYQAKIDSTTKYICSHNTDI